MNTVLIVSPHPDDLEIGMGGTAAKLASEGENIVSVVVTDGRRSTNVDDIEEGELAELREEEVRNSCRILGISALRLLRLQDIFSDVNIEKFKSAFPELLEELRPSVIYVPHPRIDKHPTHRQVSGLILDILAELEVQKDYIAECWCYEVWTPFDHYDRLEDITAFIDLKSRAVESHRSQTAYKDYTDGILGLNRYRAVFNETSGYSDIKYAEVFIRLDY